MKGERMGNKENKIEKIKREKGVAQGVGWWTGATSDGKKGF